jgi:hypothetical protein
VPTWNDFRSWRKFTVARTIHLESTKAISTSGMSLLTFPRSAKDGILWLSNRNSKRISCAVLMS